MQADDLRPKGTVPVSCAKCGSTWWVDPLDKNLPDGPPGGWDCGSDHDKDNLQKGYLAQLEVNTGIHWTGTSMSTVTGTRTLFFADRENKRRGVFVWTNPEDWKGFPDTISWDPAVYKKYEEARFQGAEYPPEGMVLVVNYRLNGKIRRYTFGVCSREGCSCAVAVDYDEPGKKLSSTDYFEVGIWGSGYEPTPSWSPDIYTCEDSLTGCNNLPCEVVNGPVIAELKAKGITWVMWDWIDKTMAVVLFRRATSGSDFGLLVVNNINKFKNLDLIESLIDWGPLDHICRAFRMHNGAAQNSTVCRAVKETMIFYGSSLAFGVKRDMHLSSEHPKFAEGQRVHFNIDGNLRGTGRIRGLATTGLVDFWIVETDVAIGIDKEVYPWSCITVSHLQLTAVEEAPIPTLG